MWYRFSLHLWDFFILLSSSSSSPSPPPQPTWFFFFLLLLLLYLIQLRWRSSGVENTQKGRLPRGLPPTMRILLFTPQRLTSLEKNREIEGSSKCVLSFFISRLPLSPTLFLHRPSRSLPLPKRQNEKGENSLLPVFSMLFYVDIHTTSVFPFYT